MRRIAIILLLAFSCALAWGGTYMSPLDQLPTPVQVCPNTGATCAFAQNVVSGNFIFIAAHTWNTTLTTPTDTRSTSWTLVASRAPGASTDSVYLWCGVLGSGGAETITLNGSISFAGQVSFEMAPFAGISCTADTSATGATATTTTTTSNITTTQNGDFVLCYMAGDGSGSQDNPHAGSGLFSVKSQNGSDASGLAFGFAGTNGTYNCVFDGTDNSANYLIAAFKPSAASMVTSSLPTAALSNSYSYTPQCVGGAGAYTWSISSGALPTGLSINSSTGAITGTPTGGTSTPTIKCDDGTHNATAALGLTVNSSASTASVVSSCGLSANGASCSLGTVTSGNCLGVTAYLGNGSKISPPTDSLGTTFKYIGNQHTSTGSPGHLSIAMWTAKATSTGADTVTLPSSEVGITAAQLTNAQCGFADVVGFSGGQNAGSVTISGSSLTTLAPGSEIWSVIIGWTSSTTWTAGTGFSAAGGTSGGAAPMQAVAANESSTGTYTPSFVQTGNADGHWVNFGIAFRPGTSGVVASGAVRHKSQVF